MDAEAFVDRFVFQFRFLEEVEAAVFVEEDRFANFGFEVCVGGGVIEPGGFVLEAAFDVGEAFDEVVLDLLHLGDFGVSFLWVIRGHEG